MQATGQNRHQTDILDPDKGYPAQLKSCSGGRCGISQIQLAQARAKTPAALSKAARIEAASQPGRYSRRKPEIRRGVQRQDSVKAKPLFVVMLVFSAAIRPGYRCYLLPPV